MTEQHHFPIATIAEESTDFRRVLWTGRHSQLVVMTIPVGDEIGEEIHAHVDQILTVVSGSADVTLGSDTTAVVQGDLVTVPAGTRHNVVNTGALPLRLYTVYAPPEHAIDAVHATKADAEDAEESGEDTPPPVL